MIRVDDVTIVLKPKARMQNKPVKSMTKSEICDLLPRTSTCIKFDQLRSVQYAKRKPLCWIIL